MASLNRLFVLALILFFVSSRLLTAEEQPPQTEGAEDKPAVETTEPPKEGATDAVEKKAEEPPAEKKEEAKKEESKASKPAEKLPHKSKVTFFIVVGIIVLGLGAIGAAHFLKNSQVSR